MAGHKLVSDEDALKILDLLENGCTQKDAAKELDVSVPTLAKRIGALQDESGVVMQYRALQSIELTKLQAQVLDAITPDKIAEASLRDLVLAFKVLNDKERTMDGKPTEVKSLVTYLLEIEKEDLALRTQPKALDVAFVEEDEDEDVPQL